MQISSVSSSSTSFQASQVMQAPVSEEATESVHNGAEEAKESPSIAKAAEQDRGMANKVDLLA